MRSGTAVVVSDNRSLRIGRVRRRDGDRQRCLGIGVHMCHLDRPL